MGKTLQFQNYGPCSNWVDNEWVPAQEGKTISIVSPYFDKEIATVPDSSKADLDAVVNSAKEAFPGWASTNIQDRSKVTARWPESTDIWRKYF
jgi:acyl-CoA reductase-like NAD-dependent aldehyde dehydrogenase|tara:strand:- start:187 stop:465 length:279 start_codon:yes stop_codon:yes gene_type:complete